jgi:ubiquinone biosynthesis protein
MGGVHPSLTDALTVGPGDPWSTAHHLLGTVTVRITFRSALALVLALVFVVVLALVSSRLVGIRVGRVRAVLTAVLGTVIGLAGAQAVVHGRRSDLDVAYALAALFGVLATMLLLIIPEAVARRRVPGTGRRSKRVWLHPLRGTRRALAPISRSMEVLGAARRRGLARPQYLSSEGVTTPQFGRSLRLTLEDVGGMFVKFGQIASTRSDLLAPPVIDELSRLRAAVRPIPAEQVRPLVEQELGHPVDEVFTTFEFEPVASASIGQAHRAVLKTGESVIVKIQRPDLDDLLRRDATVLRLVAGIAERRVHQARQIGIRQLAEELITGMDQELDYLREATMCDRLRSAIHHDEPGEDVIRVPEIFHEWCTDRLLVMEEATGQPIDAPGAVAASGAPPHVLATALLTSFLRQVLVGGVFHADPHPGNLMVDRWGQLWLLDFGAVGLIDPGTRQALEDMAIGMSAREPLMVARAVRRLAGADATADLQSLESDIGLLMTETAGGFDPSLIHQVLSVMTRHGLQVPRAMTSLSRALLTLDGTLRVIDPTFELATEAPTAADTLRPPDEEIAGDLLEQELRRSLPILRTLPEQVDEVVTQLRAGRLSVRTERFADRDERVVSAWIDRVLVAVFGCVGLVASGLVLVAAGLARSQDVRLSMQAIGFIGLVLGSVLFMRSVAQVLRRERTSYD